MDVKLQDKKIELIQWLTTLEDPSIIKKLITFRQKETQDWWDHLPENEKASIDSGIADAENNNLKPHAEARNIYEKWL